MKTLGGVYEDLKRRIGDQEARYLMQHVAGMTWADVIADPGRVISEADYAAIEAAAGRVEAGEPVSRVLGEREFWGLSFQLSPETLDPRPDTEVLVERALAHFEGEPPERVLDLGTGSGCIIIALLSEWKDARGVAVDLSLGALQAARKNAAVHGVLDRLDFVCGSWGDGLGPGGRPYFPKFDLIVSNPPYIKSSVIQTLADGVKNHDPIFALDGGADGLDEYKNIFSTLPLLLKSHGRAFLEIGYDQADDMMRLSKDYRIRIHDIFPDYAGRARVVDMSCGDK